jgi:hypothetical protein
MNTVYRAVLASALIPTLASSQSVAPGTSVITAAKMRADLEFLSGDGFRGRLTNTPENALALEWMKARFQRLGLKPMGASGAYSAVRSFHRTLAPKTTKYLRCRLALHSQWILPAPLQCLGDGER